MRILHIIPTLRKGGAERLALDICIELSKREGIDVALIVLSNENNYPALADKAFVKFIPSKVVPSLTGKTVVAINELMNFIHQFKPDIIHSHLFEAEMVSRYQLIKGIKYFSHCHDNMHQLSPFTFSTLFNKKLLTQYYERIIMLRQYKKCNNSFVAISRHAEQYFRNVLPGYFSKRIFLLHNAIQLSNFSSALRARNSMPLRLINIGSFVAKKNQQLLPDVVKYLTENGCDVELTMLGDGPLKNAVTDKVKSLGLEAKIHLPGNVEDVPAHLAQANIYVHAATYEPFGLVLIEAMAAGLPVVCLDGGGNRDIMEQNKNGIMVHQQDAKVFAEAILHIANNPTIYNEMSAYAAQYAARFDIKPYVDRLLELYRG